MSKLYTALKIRPPPGEPRPTRELDILRAIVRAVYPLMSDEDVEEILKLRAKKIHQAPVPTPMDDPDNAELAYDFFDSAEQDELDEALQDVLPDASGKQRRNHGGSSSAAAPGNGASSSTAAGSHAPPGSGSGGVAAAAEVQPRDPAPAKHFPPVPEGQDTWDRDVIRTLMPAGVKLIRETKRHRRWIAVLPGAPPNRAQASFEGVLSEHDAVLQLIRDIWMVSSLHN